MGEETEWCIPIVSENSAEQTEGQEFVCYLFPYEEENAVRKEACLISNSAYQLAGQLPFRKKEHRYVQVSDETVLVERIKPEENGEGILLWLQETADRETAVAVTIAGEQGEVSEVSLQGQPMKPLERRIVCLKRGKKKE